MARTQIEMPQLGETVTEGTIIRWLKKVGDEVKADDLLFEVSTDKVDSEVPSPEAGYLVEILVEEGETVEVGTPIAVLSDSPDEAGETDAPEEEPEEPEEPEEEREEEPAKAKEPEEEPEEPEEPEEEPAKAKEPEEAPEEPEEPEEEPAKAEERPAPKAEGVVLSPVVRRLMAEHDVDPSEIEGTGAGGRITRNDVLAHVEGSPRDEAPAAGEEPAKEPEKPAKAPEEPAKEPAEREAPAEEPARPAVSRDDQVQVVPMSNIRKRTADHMVRSKATSPHVMMSIEVDFENVERIRVAHGEEWREEEGFGLTYLPFIARALCDAISEFPHVNASVDGDDLVVYETVNLAIAVDLDFEGLLVPVVKGADGLRMRHLARAIRDLADRARNKQLSPDEVTGGTYTITNPGPYGTFLSAPIINQPQVAILSTEGVTKRPVVVETSEGDVIAIRHVGVLSQSFDHRAFDGAYSAAFLRHMKEILETRDWEDELA